MRSRSAMWSSSTVELVQAAIVEDLASVGDLTAGLVPDGHRVCIAGIVSRSTGVLSGAAMGSNICEAFGRELDAEIEFEAKSNSSAGTTFTDGDPVRPGDCVATLRGPLAAVLTVERTLLNFLGRMSGVATLTRLYVSAAKTVNPQVEVLDTRKTLPGWRELDKYAVRCGGGVNHRFGLFDAVLIKDNHIAGIPTPQLAARLTKMLARLPATPRPGFVEVEVDSLEQLAQVLRVPGIDYVLLDNFSLDDLRKAVHLRDASASEGAILLEASGGVTLETVGPIAATGMDRISVGAITHSAPSFDFGLDLP